MHALYNNESGTYESSKVNKLHVASLYLYM